MSMKNPASFAYARSRFISRLKKKRVKRGEKWARGLLTNQTPTEKRLGEILTGLGINFVPQKAFHFENAPYSRIVDFFLPDHYIAIELDGSGHFTKRGLSRDFERGKQFASEYPHVKFLRYRNSDLDHAKFPENLPLDISEMVGGA